MPFGDEHSLRSKEGERRMYIKLDSSVIQRYFLNKKKSTEEERISPFFRYDRLSTLAHSLERKHNNRLFFSIINKRNV